MGDGWDPILPPSCPFTLLNVFFCKYFSIFSHLTVTIFHSADTFQKMFPSAFRVPGPGGRGAVSKQVVMD